MKESVLREIRPYLKKVPKRLIAGILVCAALVYFLTRKDGSFELSVEKLNLKVNAKPANEAPMPQGTNRVAAK